MKTELFISLRLILKTILKQPNWGLVRYKRITTLLQHQFGALLYRETLTICSGVENSKKNGSISNREKGPIRHCFETSLEESPNIEQSQKRNR